MPYFQPEGLMRDGRSRFGAASLTEKITECRKTGF